MPKHQIFPTELSERVGLVPTAPLLIWRRNLRRYSIVPRTEENIKRVFFKNRFMLMKWHGTVKWSQLARSKRRCAILYISNLLSPQRKERFESLLGIRPKPVVKRSPTPEPVQVARVNSPFEETSEELYVPPHARVAPATGLHWNYDMNIRIPVGATIHCDGCAQFFNPRVAESRLGCPAASSVGGSFAPPLSRSAKKRAKIAKRTPKPVSAIPDGSYRPSPRTLVSPLRPDSNGRVIHTLFTKREVIRWVYDPTWPQRGWVSYPPFIVPISDWNREEMLDYFSFLASTRNASGRMSTMIAIHSAEFNRLGLLSACSSMRAYYPDLDGF